MKDKKRRFLPPIYMVAGLAIAALFGVVISQHLLGKPQRYREHMLWKYSVLFNSFVLYYVFRIYHLGNYTPILVNLPKCVGRAVLLAMPFYVALVLTRAVSINAVLTILPAQLIFLVTVFIWFVATEIDPELEKFTVKITVKGFLLVAIVTFIFSGNLPDSVTLSLSSLAALTYSLSLLSRAKKKSKSSPELTKIEE
ncbi:hypothetical protein EDD75_1089 [Thermodesulfitimonas autotrophica]|uniref:Uncharacterized protein n=1 Tax=Thermodesulfitimonas autotrophica TaxID=1894989 RepID=A0A3N5ANZ7_9THEO|nr:hypothetical protein [Thermodesulfitimonas autotrophica]RPF46829.1 hypothetical protein EDD75_1089 [Thermodesulfitimonas autotrophica]